MSERKEESEYKEESKSIDDRPSSSFGSHEQPKTKDPFQLLTESKMSTDGTKRKRELESPDIRPHSLLTTVKDIREKAKQIMEGINLKICKVGTTDEEVIAFKDYIKKTISKMGKDERKAVIGIFGRTGEGKSSLINAVLGEQFLLPSGGFGACTAVITQVEANLNDSNYIAEIDLISKEEWENEIDFSNKDDDIFQEKIRALLGKKAEDLHKDDILTKTNPVWFSTRTISSTDRCEFIKKFTSYIQHNEMCPGDCFWPLVKSVTIKIPNCRELLEHIVLIDLPGTGDCNKIRDDLWKSKLKECSSVWIVSDIKRAVTDRDPWEILQHFIEDLGPGGECKHINFICTKSDDMNQEEYLRSARLDEENIEGEGLDIKTQCIIHRNIGAKEILKKKLANAASKHSGFITDVFTISSSAHFDDKPDTGIQELTNVLMSYNMSIKKKLTRDYINEAKGLLSLIQSVQLDSGNMSNDCILEKLLKILEKELKRLSDHFESLHTILKRYLTNGVQESEESKVLKQDIFSSVFTEDKTIVYNTCQAVCRKKGCHWPKGWNNPINLNQFLTKHMYDNINDKFEWMFSDDDKNSRSILKHLNNFSISQSDLLRSPTLYHLGNFIKSKEDAQKAALSDYIVKEKKEIHSSIYKTIKGEMAPGYNETMQETGEGALQRMRKKMTDTVQELNPQMFNKAKEKVLDMFKKLEVYTIETLESELKSSMKISLSPTKKITLFDVNSEIQELESLSKALSV